MFARNFQCTFFEFLLLVRVWKCLGRRKKKEQKHKGTKTQKTECERTKQRKNSKELSTPRFSWKTFTENTKIRVGGKKKEKTAKN